MVYCSYFRHISDYSTLLISLLVQAPHIDGSPLGSIVVVNVIVFSSINVSLSGYNTLPSRSKRSVFVSEKMFIRHLKMYAYHSVFKVDQQQILIRFTIPVKIRRSGQESKCANHKEKAVLINKSTLLASIIRNVRKPVRRT